MTEPEQGQLPMVTAPEATLPEVFVPEVTAPEIAQIVGARKFAEEMNQATLPTAIQRDQWWLDETAPPATLSTQLHGDQWWLDETAPQAPAAYVDTVRYMMQQATAQEPTIERGEGYVDTVRYVMLNH